MDQLLEQLGIQLNYTRELLIVALILGRIMPMIVLTPFFGGSVAPTQIKMGLGVLLTVLVWPAARESVTGPIPYTVFGFLILMLKEIFVGMVIGFVNAHMFYAMEMAGRLIDTVRNVSMSEVLVPGSKQRITTTGNLYYQLFLVIFFVLGAHHIFLQGFFLSFTTIPINESIGLGEELAPLVDFILRLTADILLISVTLASPVMAATFITDVVFGILNRVAPQLNAYFMSMPVKAWGGVIVIFVALGAIATRLEDYSLWAVNAAQDAIDHLSRGMGN